MALRWKKKPRPAGLARIGAGTQGSALSDGTYQYASVYPFRRGYETLGWYWVARCDPAVPLKNTCNDILPDEASAKAAAMAYVRDCLAKVSARPSPPREKQ